MLPLKNNKIKHMKKIHLALILCISLVLFSCKKEEKIQYAEIKIEGMTCEIGCAKLIESKVRKIEGIKSSEVSFEQKRGQFTFDSNKTSLDDIEKMINGIAGGKLYKVIEIKSVEHLDPMTEFKK
jgi:copper chaperone CopZ